MAHGLIRANLVPGGVDKRRAMSGNATDHCRIVSRTIFTANAAGTVNTIVGANASPAISDANIIRRGEKFRLFTAAGVPKDNNVYTVAGIAIAASTTVSFVPAAPVATVSGDIAKRVTLDDFMDTESMDRRLKEINATSYSDARLAQMSVNDKQYALMLEADKDRL